MPRGDGTGPAGRGPMTGRAAGYCAGYEVPGYMNTVFGPGMAMGRGRGVGRGRARGRAYRPPATRPAAPVTNLRTNKQDELEYLKNVAQDVEEELEAIRTRIEQLEADTE